VRYDDHVLPWLERVRDEVPGLELFDTHTHIGANDPDGYRCTREELVAGLERADARAVVFAMHEPEGYPPANDCILEEAEAAGDRLVPFCRLDPRAGPVAEAERCIEAGARGIKLHPRAEGFAMDEPAVEEIAALAHERRLPVLVHAGRGIPALGRHAVDLCGRFPDMRLILAHAGISDLAWIWREAPDHPNLFFDTAWWGPSDLVALTALVPPGQILFGSDAPYATTAFGAAIFLRHALQLGLSEEQIRGMAGGQLERLLAREDPADLGPPPGAEAVTVDPLLDRVHSFLMTSVGRMVGGGDAEETLGLAALACEVGDDAPQAEVCQAVLSLLEERAEYAKGGPDSPRFAPGVHLVALAGSVVRTPDVALPEPRVPVDVGEREAGA
jgi:uncharacterized protein